jgi:small-conductance mechanosensitive channel
MNIVEQIKNGALTDPKTLLGAIFYALVFLFLAWLFGRALHLAVKRLLTKDTHNRVDRTAVNFLAQLARIAVYIFAFISYAHIVPALAGLGTAWLASVGIISVIIGLAAQNTLGNLIAGVSLLLYRPFRVGDRLQVTAPTGLETGVVESLNLGYTVLKTDDNRQVVLPNSIMASQTTINLTREDSLVSCSIPIGISYDSDIDKVRTILLELASQHRKAQKTESCHVTKLGPSSVILTLEVWCADGQAARALRFDLLEEVKKRFDQDGIKFSK